MEKFQRSVEPNFQLDLDYQQRQQIYGKNDDDMMNEIILK